MPYPFRVGHAWNNGKRIPLRIRCWYPQDVRPLRLLFQAAALSVALSVFAETPDETEWQVFVVFMAAFLVFELTIGGVRVWKRSRNQ